MEYNLQNEMIDLVVSSLGAEMRSLRFGGAEYLWQGDATYWGERSPLLFPYVGRLTGGKYRLSGREYAMNLHGFARKKEFALEEKTGDRLVFLLEDDSETLQQYPYHFQLWLCYTLRQNQVEVAYKVLNLSEKEMFFGIGGHPGFRLPLEEGLCFEDYYLAFDSPHTPSRIGFTKSCFLNGINEPYTLAEGCRLPLRHDLFDGDAIVLTNVAKRATLKTDKGGRSVSMEFENWPYLGLWQTPKKAAPYLCLEPWLSLPARQDIVEDFACQAGLVRLPAGESWQNAWALEIS